MPLTAKKPAAKKTTAKKASDEKAAPKKTTAKKAAPKKKTAAEKSDGGYKVLDRSEVVLILKESL